jgi:hypothetical protein
LTQRRDSVGNVKRAITAAEEVPMNDGMSIRASRMGYFTIALVIGPLLSYWAMMLISDGLGFVQNGSAWLVAVGLSVAAAFTCGIGKVARRSTKEIVLAAGGSVAVTFVVAVTLIVIW